MSEVVNSRVVKRRPRIVAMQKRLLVQLVENYFIRMTGHCSNVSFEAIDLIAFEKFAAILNTWGPSKTARGWKSSFYYMKNRIRRSVEMILQSNASVKDNLSEWDFKLYSMSPSWFHGVLEEMTNGVEPNDNFGSYADEDALNSDVVEEAGNSADFKDFEYYVEEQVLNTDVAENDTVESPYRLNEELDSGNFESKYDTRRVVVAENAEELECYMNTPVILSDEEELRETICPVTDTDTQHNTIALEDCPEESHNDVHGLPSLNPQLQSHNNVRCIAAKQYPAKGAPKTKILNAIPAAKRVSNAKIPEMQKERLIQIVQNNFLKAFGRFTGANGAHIKVRFWESTAKELNTMGPPRTAEQWKTTFTNIKTSAKAKLADDHNNVGGLVTKPLTRLEEKVLSIYGMNALDGSQQLGEGGFRYKKTVPASSRACESTVTSGAFENLSSNLGSQETTLDVSTDPNEPEIENASNNLSSMRPSDDEVLNELIREIWEQPDADTIEAAELQRSAIPKITPAPKSTAVVSTTGTLNPQRSMTQTTNPSRSEAIVGTNSKTQPKIRVRELNSNNPRSENRFNSENGNLASASRPRCTDANRSHGSSHGLNSTRISRGPSNGANRSRGSSNSVSGVPRLRVRRRRSSSSERLEEITDINQFFNDDDSEEEDRRNSRRESRRENANTRTGNTNEENTDRSVARVERDRSNLRHRYTSFEMVQQSMEAQERFIEDNNRNHSELMFASERNHAEMIGIFNSTLRTLANVGQQFLNKM